MMPSLRGLVILARPATVFRRVVTFRRRAQIVEQEHNSPVSSKEDGNGGNVRRKSTGNVNPHRDSYCRGYCVRVYDGRVLGGSVAMSEAENGVRNHSLTQVNEWFLVSLSLWHDTAAHHDLDPDRPVALRPSVSVGVVSEKDANECSKSEWGDGLNPIGTQGARSKLFVSLGRSLCPVETQCTMIETMPRRMGKSLTAKA